MTSASGSPRSWKDRQAARSPISRGAALAVWLLNDHWAKAACPGMTTGKLSDVASLIVFPIISVGALALWRRRRGGPATDRTWAAAWLIATGAVMATINVLDPAAWAYRHGLGLAQWPLRAGWHLLSSGDLPGPRPVHLTMDPSDLLTLPALLVPWWLLRPGFPALRRGRPIG